MRLIDADALKADDEITLWISNDAIRTGKQLKLFSELFIKKIDNAPTVEDRPQGEWREVTNGRGGHECNQCGEYAPSYQSGDEYLSKFCPNCGAKMFEPQKGSGEE